MTPRSPRPPPSVAALRERYHTALAELHQRRVQLTALGIPESEWHLQPGYPRLFAGFEAARAFLATCPREALERAHRAAVDAVAVARDRLWHLRSNGERTTPTQLREAQAGLAEAQQEVRRCLAEVMELTDVFSFRDTVAVLQGAEELFAGDGTDAAEPANDAAPIRDEEDVTRDLPILTPVPLPHLGLAPVPCDAAPLVDAEDVTRDLSLVPLAPWERAALPEELQRQDFTAVEIILGELLDDPPSVRHFLPPPVPASGS